MSTASLALAAGLKLGMASDVDVPGRFKPAEEKLLRDLLDWSFVRRNMAADVGGELLIHIYEQATRASSSNAAWVVVGFLTTYLLSRSDDTRDDPKIAGTLLNPFQVFLDDYRSWLARAHVPKQYAAELVELVGAKKPTADEKERTVRKVMSELRDTATRQDNESPPPTPSQSTSGLWSAGSFFLVVCAFIAGLIALLAYFVRGYFALSLVIVAVVLLVVTVGAFTLTQQDKIKDKTLLEIIRVVVGNLPALRKRPAVVTEERDDGETSAAATGGTRDETRS